MRQLLLCLLIYSRLALCQCRLAFEMAEYHAA